MAQLSKTPNQLTDERSKFLLSRNRSGRRDASLIIYPIHSRFATNLSPNQYPTKYYNAGDGFLEEIIKEGMEIN